MLIYVSVLTGLFRARHRIGIGAFFCALGVMHFLETYLASSSLAPSATRHSPLRYFRLRHFAVAKGRSARA